MGAAYGAVTYAEMPGDPCEGVGTSSVWQRSSAQEDRVEYAAEMGKDPNRDERAAICLVVVIEMGAEPVPAHHQSADDQTGRADQRNQPQGPVQCHPGNVFDRERPGFPAIPLHEYVVDNEDPGAGGQQDHDVPVRYNSADTDQPPGHDEQHQRDNRQAVEMMRNID